MNPIHPRFDPSPEMAAQILERIAAREGSLADIARDFNTTFRGLVEWANRDETWKILRTLEQALELRDRFVKARLHDRDTGALGAAIARTSRWRNPSAQTGRAPVQDKE